MHGLKTIHQLNREAVEAREICEKHGVALGDIPALPTELPAPVPADKCDSGAICAPDCTCPAVQPVDYDRPNVDESAK